MTSLKIIVVCLALANVFYFLWTHGIAEPQPVPVTADAVPGPTLKLVSEVPEAQREPPAESGAESSGAPDASGASAALPASAAKRCITVGPFRDVAEAAHAASILRAGGYDPRQRVVDGDVWAGVWVYLPLPGAAGASEALLSKLKSAGIDDALEMPGPGEGPVISRGLYSEQKRAQTRVAQARALGLKPEMTDRKRTGNVYWVDIDQGAGDGALNSAQLQGDASRISRLEIKPCDSGASP
jgi:hypothetical protein